MNTQGLTEQQGRTDGVRILLVYDQENPPESIRQLNSALSDVADTARSMMATLDASSINLEALHAAATVLRDAWDRHVSPALYALQHGPPAERDSDDGFGDGDIPF